MDNTSEKTTRVINQNNLELSKNSRGWTYSVKIYGNDAEKVKALLKEYSTIAEELIKEKESEKE